jgi:glycosyltransferase involved in cell wall biosynthesis
MKKIIIVNNNMKVCGVQKSLYNLLWAMEGKYEITLLLFSATGQYLDKLPAGVKVVACRSLFRYLGISQQESRKSPVDAAKRAALVAICRVFGRSAVMKILLASQKVLPETYDCAIAFLHNGREKSFYGGVQEFVLHKLQARRKAAYLHCDYRNCGANQEKNNQLIDRFDRIAACSDGCRQAFLEVLPSMEGKCLTVRNCHRFDEIRAMAALDTECYDDSRLNVLIVARLAHEKGVERAMEAVAYAAQQGIGVTLHIVGSGAMEESLRQLARELGEKQFVFYGEQANPYRFMSNADLLLLTSYHEAAPMVIEEAGCLGLPVLTVKTTSSHEMVTAQNCGWVCDNSQEALNDTLLQVLSDGTALRKLRAKLRQKQPDNEQAQTQFLNLIEG